MLTSVGRASARRVQTSRFTTSTPATTQLFCRKSAITPALPIRSFTASAWSPSPAASDKKPAKKTTSTTSTTKKAAATTIKPKSKPKSSATETNTKPKPKAKPKSKAAVEKKPKKPKKEVDPEKLKKTRNQGHQEVDTQGEVDHAPSFLMAPVHIRAQSKPPGRWWTHSASHRHG